MNILQLLSKLRSLDVKISLFNNDIQINAPKGTLAQPLIDELRERKLEIINFRHRSVIK